MKQSQELIHDWQRKYEREKKQREWDNTVNSYARWKRMIEIGKKLNHQATIAYCQSCMNEAEQKFPMLKKLFEE